MWSLTALPSSHIIIKNFMNLENIERIKELGNEKEFETSRIGGLGNSPEATQQSLEIRSSTNTWIEPNEKSEWLFRQLTDAINEANKKFFGFNLTAFEHLQFTKYSEELRGRYGLHADVYGLMSEMRKLSVVIMLSDPADYAGGELKISLGEHAETVNNEQGTAIFFPSYCIHEVTPVTRGTRLTLVTWVRGPKFI